MQWILDVVWDVLAAVVWVLRLLPWSWRFPLGDGEEPEPELRIDLPPKVPPPPPEARVEVRGGEDDWRFGG